MNIFDLPVHPAADLWPMIDAEGLQELSDDIKENGLIDPLVIGADENGEMVLIDGRNRLAACKIANVDPETVTLADRDIRKFIRSKNKQRRHIKKYQLAMADALMFPEAVHGGDRKTGSSCKKQLEVDAPDAGALSKARTVIAYANNPANEASMLAKEVLAGLKSLTEAYKDVKDAEKTPIKTKEQRLADLAAEDSELGAMVADDIMSLVVAEAALKAKKEEAAAERKSLIDSVSNGLGMALQGVAGLSNPKSLNTLLEWIEDDDVIKTLQNHIIDGARGIPRYKEDVIAGMKNLNQFIIEMEKI